MQKNLVIHINNSCYALKRAPARSKSLTSVFSPEVVFEHNEIAVFVGQAAWEIDAGNNGQLYTAMAFYR
jgi:hypothetical protein